MQNEQNGDQVIEITETVHSANLFSMTGGADVEASGARYAEMLAAAYRQAYPDADVSVHLGGAEAHPIHVIVRMATDDARYGPYMDIDVAEDGGSDVWQSVQHIGEQLWKSGDWLVALETRTITVNGHAYTITAQSYDNGYAPEATDEQGQSVYLGGEDDEDDVTPAEALTRGERYLREQAERGNL